MRLKQAVPWILIALRALGGPGIVLGAMHGWSGGWLSAFVIAALVTDIYDGVLARRWNCETPLLRLLDSLADTVFYLGVIGVLWLREAGVLKANWLLFAILFGLEAVRYVFDLWKFGRSASYHSYLAKTWGLLIVIAVAGSLNAAKMAVLIPIAVCFGIVVNLEGLAMSAMLPLWKNDVKTLRQAWRLRLSMIHDGQADRRP